MKKFIAISLSLAMVFALFGAMTVSVSAEEEYVTKTLYSFEDGKIESGVKHSTFKTFASSSAKAYDGSYSLAVLPNTAVWSKLNNYVSESNYKNWVSFAFPEGLNITGKVGFYLYNPQGNTSNYEAYGIKMANGDKYYTKYSNFSKNSWKCLYVTGTTMYKYGDTSTTIKPTAANFADDAADDQRIVSLIFVDAGCTDSGTQSYIDNVFYQTTEAPSDPTITMASGAAMRIDGDTDGIRFEATVDKTAFDALVSENATVDEIGTLIAKAGTDISKVVVENAVDTSTGAMKLADGKIPVAKYAAGTKMQDVAGTDKYVIYGSLVEIKPNNANQQYVARAYVKYTDSTGSHVLYASALSEARSIAQVAKAIVDANPTDGYLDSLCAEHKKGVTDWADKYVAQ